MGFSAKLVKVEKTNISSSGDREATHYPGMRYNLTCISDLHLWYGLQTTPTSKQRGISGSPCPAVIGSPALRQAVQSIMDHSSMDFLDTLNTLSYTPTKSDHINQRLASKSSRTVETVTM